MERKAKKDVITERIRIMREYPPPPGRILTSNQENRVMRNQVLYQRKEAGTYKPRAPFLVHLRRAVGMLAGALFVAGGISLIPILGIYSILPTIICVVIGGVLWNDAYGYQREEYK